LRWPAAQLVWVPFVYGPLAVVIWYAFAPLLRRVSGPAPLRLAAFAVIFAACAYLFPVRDEMRFGQVDLVLLAMAVADCAARPPPWPRGLLVGLAAAVKLVPGADQSLRGLLRAFALVRRLARDSREMEAIAVTALVGVLASPSPGSTTTWLSWWPSARSWPTGGR
jgi:hypothetical protein